MAVGRQVRLWTGAVGVIVAALGHNHWLCDFDSFVTSVWIGNIVSIQVEV